MSSRVLNIVRLRSDLIRILADLNSLNSAIFKVGEGEWDEVLQGGVALDLAQVITEETATYGIKEKEKYIRDVISEVKKVTPLKLMVAVDFPVKHLHLVWAKLRSVLDKPIYLDIEVDAGLGAGAVVAFEGKTYDGSARMKVGKEWPKIMAEYETGF